jgi:iron complex transport system substrate-binding protein
VALGSVTGVRIVSLLPSTTEICFAVGAGDDVVGVTFECDFPAEAKQRRIVSTSALTPGLSAVQIDAEVKARIAAGEDLYHLDEGALATLGADLVLTVDPGRLDDVISSVVMIGEATGHRVAATEIAAALRTRLAAVQAAVAGRPRPRVAVLEWTDPAFTAGHWVPDMVVVAGGDPVLGTAGERSVETTWEQVAASAPDLVVVSPCGYRLPAAIDLARTVVAAGVLPPEADVWAVDADAAFVRPGPRLVDGVEALAGVFHPMALPARPELATRVTPAAG